VTARLWRAAHATCFALSPTGVFFETPRRKGVYSQAPVRPVQSQDLRGWLIEAALRSSDADAYALRALVEMPRFFSFAIASTTAVEIDAHTRLEWFRQGVSEDMVTLRRAS
jgi:hypothetical protein